jgi:hypothetical protein
VAVKLAERAMELSPADDDMLEIRGRFFMCDGAIEKSTSTSTSICQTRDSKCERLLSKLKQFQKDCANWHWKNANEL